MIAPNLQGHGGDMARLGGVADDACSSGESTETGLLADLKSDPGQFGLED